MLIKRIFLYLFVITTLFGCANEDLNPVYFPPGGDDSVDEQPEPNENPSASCTVTFTSQLCVIIKGDKVEAGTNGDLCVEVPPFPIHIDGSTATIKGNEFPDIQVEGHGLPVPITINARGSGDGSSNIGTGALEADGNMTFEGFSFFILALGLEGEIPNLTITTKESEETTHLPILVGSAPDTSGAMVLVTTTVLGHLIDAADAVLMGSSLSAVFSGAISPTLDACQGTSEELLEVTKIITDDEGHVAEVGLAGGKQLEVSNGTYIAESESDIGEKFEGKTKFRIKNISSNNVEVKIPPKKGSFHISSLEPLTQTLTSNKSLTITVKFRPKSGEIAPGDITEQLMIGPQVYVLKGTALDKSGHASIDAVDDNGDITAPTVDEVSVGESEVPVTLRKAYFKCDKVSCDNEERITNCKKCESANSKCDLLPINLNEQPLGEVNSNCSLKRPDEVPLYAIDISSGSAVVLIKKQILALRNKGVKPLEVKKITIEETSSSSNGEFGLLPGAVFVAQSFSAAKEQLTSALAEGNYEGTPFPFSLPPYQEGYDETTAYIIVTYNPKNLTGSDGQPAVAGNNAIDKAIIKIITDDGEQIATEISGGTVIREVPPLEVLFKTSTGVLAIAEGQAFSFRGITANTQDAAYPLYLKPSDGASSPIRIKSISISGGDNNFYEWLDTKEKINSRIPDSGKGIRCTEPKFDSSTGDLIEENDNLSPVEIGSKGFILEPGAYNDQNVPLFGCVNFHKGNINEPKKSFSSHLTVIAEELDPSGLPSKNPDGSTKELQFLIKLLAVMDPIKGHMVLRITQTSAGILHPDFPAFSSIPAYKEQAEESGTVKQEQTQIFLASLVLDPFDEMTINNADGTKIVSEPNDDCTAVFRALDTHPVDTDYDDPQLFDYASIVHDGELGLFADGYENKPEGLKVNGWRIFTGSLSYPGPTSTRDKWPNDPTECITINACDNEQHKLFSDDYVKAGEKGACAFFYASGGRYDSPAFHEEYAHPCDQPGKSQNLLDMNTGKYTIDGRLTMEQVGLRFFGPTIFHSPYGILDPFRPLDEVLHMAFTTDTLRPQESEKEPNTLPDEKIDISREQYKISLTDKKSANPPLCANNTNDKPIGGKTYSSWKYMAPFISKDKEGLIPAGCPNDKDPDNNFDGGTAYLHGRPIDHETGIFSLVTMAKFSSRRELSFAFQDVILTLILNGWVCNPNGLEEEFEGSKCYDMSFNERDALSQVSVMD